MRRVIALALVACGGPGEVTPDAAVADAPALPTLDAGVDALALADATPDARDRPDAGGSPAARILFQCDAFAGGLCVMAADGGGRDRLHASGFAPRGLDDGSVLFHTAGYRVARRLPGGEVRDLGAGAFPRPRPGGDLLFQCAGLEGGLCTMDLDGQGRAPLRATGRVPDIAADGAILFHSDGYRIVRRDPGGQERDLGEGAFATWTDDGDIVFQCSGLGGGLCRMDRDGGNRAPIAAGRVPDSSPDGDLVFHTDDYRIAVRRAASTTTLGAGANAVWWPAQRVARSSGPCVHRSSGPGEDAGPGLPQSPDRLRSSDFAAPQGRRGGAAPTVRSSSAPSAP